DAHSACLPMLSIVSLRPVIAIAYVVQCYFVAFNVGPCLLSHVRLPVAVVGRRKRPPPSKHNAEKKGDCSYLAPKRFDECERNRKSDRQESSRDLICFSERSVKPYCAECPRYSKDGGDKNEQLTDPVNYSHHTVHYGDHCTAARKPSVTIKSCCQLKAKRKTLSAPVFNRPHFPRRPNTFMTGSLEIRSRPLKGRSNSKIKKIAAAAERADTIRAALAVALRGAITLKPVKITTSQHTTTTSKGIEMEGIDCAISKVRC